MKKFYELPPLILKTDRRHTEHADRMPKEFNGLACVMVSIGDVPLFLQGKQGCLVRLCDNEKTEQLRGKLTAEGLEHVYLDEFADMPAAIQFAEALAAYPLTIVQHHGAEYCLTTRGPIVVNPVYFADGGKWPRIGEDSLQEARDALDRGLSRPVTIEITEATEIKIPGDDEPLAPPPEPPRDVPIVCGSEAPAVPLTDAQQVLVNVVAETMASEVREVVLPDPSQPPKE